MQQTLRQTLKNSFSTPFFGHCGRVQAGQNNNCITHVHSFYFIRFRYADTRPKGKITSLTNACSRSGQVQPLQGFCAYLQPKLWAFTFREAKIQMPPEPTVVTSFRISNCFTVSSVLQTGFFPTFCGSQNSIANIERRIDRTESCFVGGTKKHRTELSHLYRPVDGRHWYTRTRHSRQ